MSEAAESCLPSSLFWHELLSVILRCILLENAFWSSSVALNCAPPNMLDVWPDLQAKGVRQIKTVNFLNSLLACSTTLSGGTWMNAIPFAQSFIVYTDAALTPCLLTWMQELIFLISPHFDFFFYIQVKLELPGRLTHHFP